MFNLTLGEIAVAVNGTLHGPADLVVTDLVSDSRIAKTGDLFAAIIGERVDGHEKVQDALDLGAVATICTKPVSGPHILVKPEGESDLDPVIPALGRLAKFVRENNKSLTVIGVTGSSGKTSTKDLIGQVLADAFSTYAPAGSPNNELGLPQTILQAPSETKFLVAEMGMRGIGHINYLCDIAKPNIGVVTNVGHAHVGEIGSIENVAKGKSELIQGLPLDGTAILNFDDPLVRAMAQLTNARVFTYGLTTKADVNASELVTNADGSTDFILNYQNESVPVKLPLLGEHNVSNSLAAAATGIVAGLSLSQIAKTLNGVAPKSQWRMEVHQLNNSVTVINDAYNANPESMTAALKTLASIQTSGRRWAVLGAMHELGDESVSEHDRIGRLVVRLNIDQLVVVGQVAKPLHMGAEQEGSWDGESVWFPDFTSATDYILSRVAKHDVLLFKASRSESFDLLADQVSTAISAKGELLA